MRNFTVTGKTGSSYWYNELANCLLSTVVTIAFIHRGWPGWVFSMSPWLG